MQLLGELTGATAEIDHSTTGTRLHEGGEVPERLGAFGPEALVLIRVPLFRIRRRQPITLPFVETCGRGHPA